MVLALGALLPASLGSVSVFGIGLTTATGLTVAGSIVNMAGSLLLSTAANALMQPDMPNVRPDNVQTNSKTATGPRLKHVGVVKVGGNVVFHRASEGMSYRLIVHGHGELSTVLQYYLNNVPVDLDASGFVMDDQYQYGGRSRVQIQSRQGLVPETHYSDITDVWAEWTSAHRLDGQWTSLIKAEMVPFSELDGMYPAREPVLFAMAETAKLHDPRTDTTEFSENLALAIADLISSPDGFDRPDALDPTNVAAQADLADQAVALATGGTEARYRVSGSYALTEEPQAVLERLLAAGAGEVRLKPNGKVAIELAQVKTASFTIEYKHLLEVEEVNAGPDGLDRYNVLPGRFVSHDLGHIEVDAEAWRDETRIARDGGELVAKSPLTALMCPSHRQLRAAMSVQVDRDNPDQGLKLVCKASVFPAIFEDVVNVDVPQLRLSGKFRVETHHLQFDRGQIVRVALSLAKINDDAYSIDLTEQGAVQVLPAAEVSSGVPLPQNVTASGVGVQTAQNAFVAGIGVAWDAAPSDALSAVVKISDAGQDAWQDVPVGQALTSIGISGLVDGQTYDVSVAFATPGGVIGAAVMVEEVTASAASDAPAAPTGLTVMDVGGGAAQIALTTSVSAAHWKTQIYRDGVLVGVVSSAPTMAITFVDSCGAGTFDWTARSVNVSNVTSTSDAGPETATIA